VVLLDPKDSLIKHYQDKISEMSKMMNDPNKLKSKLKLMNPEDTEDQLQDKIDEYENKFEDMRNALVDKDKLVADHESDKKKIYFRAQIEINKLKKQRDAELDKIKKKSKLIKEKYNNANEELEALKFK